MCLSHKKNSSAFATPDPRTSHADHLPSIVEALSFPSDTHMPRSTKQSEEKCLLPTMPPMIPERLNRSEEIRAPRLSMRSSSESISHSSIRIALYSAWRTHMYCFFIACDISPASLMFCTIKNSLYHVHVPPKEGSLLDKVLAKPYERWQILYR